jgi:hypothetical protein
MSAPVPLHPARKYHGATRGWTCQLRCERPSVTFRDTARRCYSDILKIFQIPLQIQDMFCASCFKDLSRILKYKDIRSSDICFYPVLDKTFLRCTANTKWQFADRILSLLYRDGHGHSHSPNCRTSRELCPPVGRFASYISKTLQCKNIDGRSDGNAIYVVGRTYIEPLPVYGNKCFAWILIHPWWQL